jgi:membrane-anchored protein YejM (alkaline phosphatase superfamily)
LGYRSEFLTSADLDFGNTGVWAHSVGFDYVEGQEHPDYQRWPRFQFKAAADEALYRRAIDRVKLAKAQPLFLFIKTVSTHHPYLNPENQHRSEAEVFQYADRQLGHFYRQLQEAGFFGNGLLLIVGDHHALTPLKPQESEHLGHYKASAKVPLLVVGGEKSPRRESRQFQQADVFNTLQGMASGRQCRSAWQGILWGDNSKPPEWILHRRGDNRDKLSVFTETEDYLLKLDGDATQVVSRQPQDPELRKLVVDKVNALRIARTAWAKQEKSAERSN